MVVVYYTKPFARPNIKHHNLGFHCGKKWFLWFLWVLEISYPGVELRVSGNICFLEQSTGSQPPLFFVALLRLSRGCVGAFVSLYAEV